MPRISSFMYCGQAINEEDGLQINNPLNIINPGTIPGYYSLSVVFFLLGVSNSTDHTLQLMFLNNEDDELLNTGVLPIKKDKLRGSNLPEPMQGVTVSFDFRNIYFKSEGIYRTEIIFNDKVIGVFPIAVKGSEIK